MDISENLITSSDYENVVEDLQKSGIQLPEFTFDDINCSLVMPATEQKTAPVTNLLDGLPLKIESTVQPEAGKQPTTPVCTIPCRDFYPGPLNFEILLNGATADRRSWVYSHSLKKVFIDMNKSLLIQFHLQEFIPQLRVRALLVYSQQDHVSQPVERCSYHVFVDDKNRKAHTDNVCQCSKYKWAHHIVRSKHPHAQYEYHQESRRHSLVVPLDPPQAGTDTTTVEYHFVCKSSCLHGMKRRPIDVVFTLETSLGEVIGRQLLAVKICSCPRRDKEKEESDFLMCNNNFPQDKRKLKERVADVSCTKRHKNVHKVDLAKGCELIQGDENLLLLTSRMDRLETQLQEIASQLQSIRGTLEIKMQEISTQIQVVKGEMDTKIQLILSTLGLGQT